MPDTKRPRGLLVAVVLLCVLLGASLLALVLARGGHSTPAASAERPGPAPTRSSPQATRAVPAPLTAAPTGIRWELFEGVALPTSRIDGPTRIGGPIHAGFSHSPTGALLADAQISYRTLVDPDLAALRQVSQVELADGSGKTAYLNLLSQLTDNNPPVNGYAQIIGFRYITYTPEVAVVSLATRGASARVQVGIDTLRWDGSDWKLDKPATGLQQPQVVQDTAGYVPWSGVS